jgi:hypothetical protein
MVEIFTRALDAHPLWDKQEFDGCGGRTYLKGYERI